MNHPDGPERSAVDSREAVAADSAYLGRDQGHVPVPWRWARGEAEEPSWTELSEAAPWKRRSDTSECQEGRESSRCCQSRLLLTERMALPADLSSATPDAGKRWNRIFTGLGGSRPSRPAPDETSVTTARREVFRREIRVEKVNTRGCL